MPIDFSNSELEAFLDESLPVDRMAAIPGVTNVLVIEGTGKPTEVMPGVAILATSTYAAIAARRKLRDERRR